MRFTSDGGSLEERGNRKLLPADLTPRLDLPYAASQVPCACSLTSPTRLFGGAQAPVFSVKLAMLRWMSNSPGPAEEDGVQRSSQALEEADA